MHTTRKCFNNGGKWGTLMLRKFWYLWGNLPRIQHVFRNPNSGTATHTTYKTVNRLARKQLHLNYVVSERPKGGISRSRETKALLDSCKKHKNFAWQTYSFLKVKLRRSVSEEKCTKANMLSLISINILYLQAVLIKQPGPASQYRTQISKIFTEKFLFSPRRQIQV